MNSAAIIIAVVLSFAQAYGIMSVAIEHGYILEGFVVSVVLGIVIGAIAGLLMGEAG